MDVDGAEQTYLPDEDMPTCASPIPRNSRRSNSVRIADSSIEAPPSVLPQRRYCDITGLEVSPRPPYTIR